MRKSLWFTSAGGAARITIALACLFLSATGARADTFTYTYAGNNFTIVDAPYTTSEKETGTFELSAALPPNLHNNDESSLVLSFTMSDGVQTLTSAEAFVEAFAITTDSAGAITRWDVEVAITGGFAPSIETLGNPFASEDIGSLTDSIHGVNVGTPGIWTVSTTTPVPESGTLNMIFSGLLGLGLLVGVKRYRGNRLATIA
jgi:hypothetical protein